MKPERVFLSYGTESKIDPLHKELLKQFNESHGDSRTRRFLDNPEKLGTFISEEKESAPQQVDNGSVLPVLRYDPLEIKEQSISLQKWEGIVAEVKKNAFVAKLYDRTVENPEEEGEFSIDEVSEDDRVLLKPGAFFYWSIGYLTTGTGQRIRTSVIKFRRIPEWTEGELKAAEKKATELRRLIGWGSDEDEAAACA